MSVVYMDPHLNCRVEVVAPPVRLGPRVAATQGRHMRDASHKVYLVDVSGGLSMPQRIGSKRIKWFQKNNAATSGNRGHSDVRFFS